MKVLILHTYTHIFSRIKVIQSGSNGVSHKTCKKGSYRYIMPLKLLIIKCSKMFPYLILFFFLLTAMSTGCTIFENNLMVVQNYSCTLPSPLFWALIPLPNILPLSYRNLSGVSIYRNETPSKSLIIFPKCKI